MSWTAYCQATQTIGVSEKMTKILVLEASLFPAEMSASRRVTELVVARLAATNTSATIVRRDLAADPLNHVGFDLMSGSMTPAEGRSESQAKAVATSDALIAELFAADVIVIGAPMYNFTIPSTLKAWIDNIAIGGKTFRYTPEGRPEGLVTGKRVFVVASRGGVYGAGPTVAFNFQDPYLRTALGLLGMTDVTVITAEQQKMGPDAQAEGLAQAQRQIVEAIADAQAA
jgi:FMN-dependent NADH-azoreductase